MVLLLRTPAQCRVIAGFVEIDEQRGDLARVFLLEKSCAGVRVVGLTVPCGVGFQVVDDFVHVVAHRLESQDKMEVDISERHPVRLESKK